MPWLFLFAYTCSGLAGLIYEVSWTRLLTLTIGHTTGAASAVVAAFLGGLAAGAAGGAAIASRVSPRVSLQLYVAIELGVAVAAFVVPWEIRALTPVLSWAYGDGSSGLLFPSLRLVLSFGLVFLPAAALGATFPLAVRGFADAAPNAARSGGALYALNTAGATAGALLAGFVLIPAIGVSGTTLVGMAASLAAALAVAVALVFDRQRTMPARARTSGAAKQGRRARGNTAPLETRRDGAGRHLATAVLGVSGFAALLHEIAWTRILALVLGPTIYAFSATLAAVIGGVAVGSAAGAWMVGRVRRPAIWLACALGSAALITGYTSSLAGGDLARLVAMQSVGTMAEDWLQRGLLVTLALVAPTAVLLGAAFPLALAIAGDGGGDQQDDARGDAARRFGLVYAVNTMGAVAGSLAAGFIVIPRLGLQGTLAVVSLTLIVTSLVVLIRELQSTAALVAGGLASAGAALAIVLSPPWDRDLLASGGYLYGAFVPADLDREALLKAGTLLYYKEGASATVSVKRLTGTTTLAVDGKTDASNRGDMLTQKLIAHLPLLLHPHPREVAIIGLGSGVTVASALRHPVARVDVLEISPEVVEASRHFLVENHHALDDPRTHLIVGDGRSHLQLTTRSYDVIVSEPSNPWIAGVAALFTREFFLAAADHLAPGGLIGQWANAYNISDPDLRAIVATFRSVFPDATVWLVGGDDVLLVGSKPGGSPVDGQLPAIETHWTRPGVAEDLAERSVHEPFSLLSMYAAGPRQLEAYARGAAMLTDDRMTLEFSAPRELHRRATGDNSAALAALLGEDEGPPALRRARDQAGAAQWRNRGGMMARRDAHATAFDDYVHALRLDPGDSAALDGLVRTAMLTRRAAHGLSWLTTLTGNRPASADVLIARSRLLAAVGSAGDAVASAREAARLSPDRPEPLDQLAALFADAGDRVELVRVVDALERMPARAPTFYYSSVAAFLGGQAEAAVAAGRRAIEIDPRFAPVYDLVGAAYTKLARPAEAREAFETSLRFDPHDSTAYTNLGLIAEAAGDRRAAANYFAEALWLTPESSAAREGLARSARH